MKDDVFKALFTDLIKEAFAKGTDSVDYHDYYKYRISFITEPKLQLIFLFVTGLTDNFENVKKELIKCRKEFLNLFEDIIMHKYDEKTFEIFDPTIDVTHKNLRPKISLVGFSGVGKTTLTRLIRAEEIPLQHIPTITGDIATIKIGKLHFHLWDFAGQEQFSYLWNNFIKGSDAVLLITDSSLENVEKSKFFLELIKVQAPHAHTAIIGNKQDLETAMKPDQIEKILGLKTYSMIAKDPVNRDKMITIIADILEMSAEVSPLLQPLLKRDTYIEEAAKALENAEFEKAAKLFEIICDLCIELGDDSLGKEFFEKSQKILGMLPQISPASPPTSQGVETPVAPSTPSVEDSPEVEGSKAFKQHLGKPIALKKLEIPLQAFKVKSSTLKKPIKVIKEKTISENLQTEISPPIPQEVESSVPKKIGLNLNPEDFMVKQRPKSISEVPKGAREKLQISPYAQVTNQEVKSENIETPSKLMPKTVMPLESAIEPIKPPEPIKVITTQQSPPTIPPEQTLSASKESAPTEVPQKLSLEKSLIDLKIKKAYLAKMSLDFDMKELTGEITAKELEDKKRRLITIEENVNNQIKEIEDLLKDFE